VSLSELSLVTWNGQKSGGNFGRAGADFLPGKEFPIARRAAFGFSSSWPPSCFNAGLLSLPSADKGRGDVQSGGGRQPSTPRSQRRSRRGARGTAWVCRGARWRPPTQESPQTRAPVAYHFSGWMKKSSRGLGVSRCCFSSLLVFTLAVGEIQSRGGAGLLEGSWEAPLVSRSVAGQGQEKQRGKKKKKKNPSLFLFCPWASSLTWLTTSLPTTGWWQRPSGSRTSPCSWAGSGNAAPKGSTLLLT